GPCLSPFECPDRRVAPSWVEEVVSASGLRGLVAGKALRILAVLALAVLGILPQPPEAHAATTWQVCAACGAGLNTIAAALANPSVVNGDTLQLTDASYNENSLGISKSLTIFGSNVTPAIIGK